MNKKSLGQELEEYLVESGFNEGEPKAFRQLYEHVEFGKKISKNILNKFIRCGIYFPNDNKIKHPEDSIGLILQAMVFNGTVQMKCPEGKIYPTKTIKLALQNQISGRMNK